MTRARLSEALARCRLPVEEAWSLPPECYTSDEMLREETRHVFGGWVGLGRADMVPDPGSYIALDVAGQPVLLLRDRDGALRAFANSCRHRGARLMQGRGTCRGIKCPFHAWAYRLDGTLAAAPHMEAASDFDKASHALHAYEVRERLGFVFADMGNGGDFDTHLGDFTALHEDWPLERLVTTRRAEIEVDCNWKAFLEVFNEYYHLPFVHADSISDIYAPPEAGNRVRGAIASQFGRTDGTGGLLQDQQAHALPPMPGLRGDALTGARYTWVFPNMTFAANRDALWVYEAYPLGPHRCRVVQTACFAPETVTGPGAERIGAYHQRLDAALDEDIAALVNQHHGLQSPATRQGRFQPLLEPNVAQFANWYAGRMADAADA